MLKTTRSSVILFFFCFRIALDIMNLLAEFIVASCNLNVTETEHDMKYCRGLSCVILNLSSPILTVYYFYIFLFPVVFLPCLSLFLKLIVNIWQYFPHKYYVCFSVLQQSKKNIEKWLQKTFAGKGKDFEYVSSYYIFFL